MYLFTYRGDPIPKNYINFSMKNDKTFRLLNEIGIQNTEALVYLKLLELGSLSRTDLARKSKIPRTTVHENVDRLIQKGLISLTNKNGRKILTAENPNKLKLFVMNKKLELETQLDHLSDTSKELDETIKDIIENVPQSAESGEVDVKYYLGLNGFKDVCQRSLSNSSKEILFLSNMDEWKKIFTDKYAYTYYVPERIKRNLFAKTLAIRSKKAEEIKTSDRELLREMRFLPDSYDFDPTIIINDNEVSIMTSSKPYTAVLIQNKSITKLFRDVFNNLWKEASIN